METIEVNDATFRPIVGIDLGTTNSAVALIRDGQPQIVASPQGDQLLPSVVLIDNQDQVIVGQDAKDSLIAMPERTIAAIKRLMGCEDFVTVAGKEFLPEDVSALILKQLREYLVPIFGDGPIEAVITVPAYFDDKQRRATKRAGELAGFIVERIINEPTAAALAYGLGQGDEHKNILVYDLGGGTFDVSVITLQDGVLEVRSSDGNKNLGGEDFDWRLVDWMAERIRQEQQVDPRKDLRARAILKEVAEKTKWTLSTYNEASIETPVLMMHDGIPVSLNTPVTAEEFTQMIQPWLDETLQLTQTALKAANLAPSDIDNVLLVGGSTRIPKVQQMMRELFDHDPQHEVDPDMAVALGAAVQAGLKSGALSETHLVVTDVAPFSMGISVVRADRWGEMVPGFYKPIISRNTTIPCTRKATVYTLYDRQDRIQVEIFQGEHDRVEQNLQLGSFFVPGIPPALAGRESVEVQFRYNLNGILEATAKIVSTKVTQGIVVQDGLDRSSTDLFESSKVRLETLAQADTIVESEANEPEEDEVLLMEEIEDIEEKEESADTLEQETEQSDVIKEAQRIVQDLQAIASLRQGSQRSSAKSLINQLEQAITRQDTAGLPDLLDEATDLLFEMEG